MDNIYDELGKKAIRDEEITWADMEQLALYDPVVAAYVHQYRVSGTPMVNALAACVCILAAQLNEARGELVRHIVTHGP